MSRTGLTIANSKKTHLHLTPKQRTFAEVYVANYPNITKKEDWVKLQVFILIGKKLKRRIFLHWVKKILLNQLRSCTMSLVKQKLSRYQQTLKTLKSKADKTKKFSDFLAVLNFINNSSFVSTHVGEVKVETEEN